MPHQTIDPELCTRCGQCVSVCPCDVYELGAEGVEINPEMAARCLRCGHCMAICPTKAVAVEGLAYEHFADIAATVASPDDLRALMLRRRSTRAFRPEPVARELLEQIVAAAVTAPMGFPPSGVEVTILPTRQDVEPVVASTVKLVAQMQKMLGSGIGRFMFRRMAGAQAFRVLNDYLMPLMPTAMARYAESGEDFVTWGAPAVLVFHTNPAGVSGETDAVLAATYAMLMAEALGLGSIMLGLAGAGLGQDKALRERYGIPPDNQVHNLLALGSTDRKFRRTIPRELKSVTWVGE